MPRVRYRRLFLLCIVLCVSFLLAINSLFWFQIKPSVVAPEDEDYPEESNQTEQLAVERKPVVIYNFTLDDRPKQHYRMEWSTGRTSTSKPWFMRNGDIRPEMSYAPKLSLWPEEIENNDDPRSDRIINQLMYVPEGYVEENFLPKGSLPLKKILLAYGKTGWSGLPFGRKKFLDDKCPVNACFIMSNPELIAKADAVIFKDRFVWPKQGRQNLNQIWIAFLLESPYNTQLFRPVDSNIFNWTATYRHDSDIVAPYEKYTTYESLYDHQLPLNLDLFENRTLTSLPIPRNYAQNKTNKVAWFVSNCAARNRRLEYARELSKHIPVDIYGSCGKHKCPRSKTNQCFEMLNTDYKFYLAFENSNCRDYITEKFYVNGLGHNSENLNIVPIVMGAHPQDYERSSPRNSFIHVDHFRSPAELAHYLTELDQDDFAYNKFLEWKSSPRQGEFINTYFWCRLCALLHAPPSRQKPTQSYGRFPEWWSPFGMCLNGSTWWKYSS